METDVTWGKHTSEALCGQCGPISQRNTLRGYKDQGFTITASDSFNGILRLHWTV